jgi:predicted DNA-binding transcriptional regulator YafY
MRRLERLYAITEEIRRHEPASVSAGWLADRFGVSRRTVERDLAALRNRRRAGRR